MQFGASELSISLTAVSPVVAQLILVSPDIDWFLLELKQSERDKIDLVSAFSCLVKKEHDDFPLIYTDCATKPKTGVIRYWVAAPPKGAEIRRTSVVY